MDPIGVKYVLFISYVLTILYIAMLTAFYPYSLHHLSSFPHPFISIISISKGKKLLPRAARHCHPDQILTMLTMLVANFESLDVCHNPVLFDPSTGTVNVAAADEAELFMSTIVPPMLAFVVEAPFRIVIGLMALFLERNNVIWVARSKVRTLPLILCIRTAHVLPRS